LDATPAQARETNASYIGMTGTLEGKATPEKPDQLCALKEADDDFALKIFRAGFSHVETMAAVLLQASRVVIDDRASVRNFAAVEHDHTARNLAYV